jgi:GNAT superfamily N-acetyltransferase
LSPSPALRDSGGMDGIDIERLDYDDRSGVVELAELEEACRLADAPYLHHQSVDMVEADLRWGHDQSPSEHYLARVDGEVAGFGAIYTSDWDNLDLAWLQGGVHPRHRGQGVGAALLEQLHARCLELDRPSLGADAWEGTPGTSFLEGRGYAKKSQAILRRQDLTSLAPGQVEGMHALALERAGDYELVSFDGPLPDDVIEDYSRMAASINDAPLDDLELEDDNYDPQRMRLVEEAQQRRNRDHLRIAARHRGTGELGGHTELVVERWDPSVAYQLDTAVAPGHRGHRLGLLLKAAMVLWLRERHPQVVTVDTWNTESNRFMIEVNEQLGYRVVARELQFQRRLG